MAGEPLSAADFEQWMKPVDALARLPGDWNERTRRGAIVRRLADGSIPAVARSCVVKDRGGTHRYSLMVVEPKLWSEPWNSYDRDFWQLGDLSFDNALPMELVYVVSLDDAPRDDRPTVTASFKDVRLDPAAFEQEFAGYLDQAAGDPDKSRTSPIAAAEIDRFVRLYLELWGDDAREMKALDAIRATYPDRSIGRDTFLARFRELRGPGKRGKPPIRGE